VWQWVRFVQEYCVKLWRSALDSTGRQWTHYGKPLESEIAVAVCGLFVLVMLVWVFRGFEPRVYLHDKKEAVGSWTRLKCFVTHTALPEAKSRKKVRPLPPLPAEWFEKMSISRLTPYYVNKLTGVSVWDHPAMPRTGSRAPSTTGSTGSSGSAKLATIRNRKTKAQRATPQSPPASPLPAAETVTPSLHAATYCNTDAEVPKAEVESDGVEATENEVESVEEKSHESEDTSDKLESVVEEGGRKGGGKGAGEDGEDTAAAAVALSMAVKENVAAAAEEATAGAAVVAEAAAGTYSH